MPAMKKTTGELVKEARKAERVSQVELANAVEISQGALSDLESGRSRETTVLHRIAYYLGVAPRQLDPYWGGWKKYVKKRHPTDDIGHQVIDPIQKNISSGSRLQRLDPVMIRNGFTIVSTFFTAHGGEFEVDTDPDLLTRAYEFEQTHDSTLLHSIEADVIARIAERKGGISGQEEATAERPKRAAGRIKR